MNQIAPQDKQLTPFNQGMRDVRSGLDKMTDDLAAALAGSSVSVDRFKRTAISAVQNNPDLLNCDRRTLFGAVVLTAQLGLVLAREMGEAAIVPYGTKATVIVEYKGLIKLAYRSGFVKSISSEIVYVGEEFELIKGDGAKIVHMPDPDAFGEREVRGAYAIAELVTGGVVREWMNIAQIDAIMNASPGSKKSDSAWRTNKPAMIRKTPLRALINRYLPKSTEAIARATAFDDPVRGPAAYDVSGEAIDNGQLQSPAIAEDLIAANAHAEGPPQGHPASEDEPSQSNAAPHDGPVIIGTAQATRNGSIKVVNDGGLFCWMPKEQCEIAEDGMVTVPPDLAQMAQWQRDEG